MRLEQRDKEFTAIGASIGANCQPCIEHHIDAALTAGLTPGEVVDSVATARAVRDEAIQLLAARIDELLGGRLAAEATPPVVAASSDQALVSLGASVGANSHALLQLHITTARELGFGSRELAAAIAMAEHVQRMAAEITAKKATTMLDQLHDAGRPPGPSSQAVEEVVS